MPIIKKQIINRFNKSVSTYDNAAEMQSEIAARLVSRLSTLSPQSILEIGCGTGLLSDHLLALFPKTPLFLTDISPAMIAHCRQRFLNQSHIQFICQDGEKLMTQSIFDLIISNMTFHWFSDIQKSVTQLLNQLTPDGKFIFTLLGENSFHEWRAICHQFNIPAATLSFPTIKNLQILFPQILLEVESYQKTYQNIAAFLRSLKQLGVTATDEEYIPLSAGKLRRIMRSDEKLHITYEVIYGVYQSL